MMTERSTNEPNNDKKNHAILFDLDGVLIDSRTRYLVYYTEVFLNAGVELNIPEIRELSTEKIIESYPMGLEAAIDHLTPDEYKAHVKEITKVAKATERYPELLVYPPDLTEALAALYSEYSLGIVTNAPDESVEELFEMHPNTRSMFDAVISGDSGFGQKPDPAPVQAALAEMNIAPENAVLAGDTIGTDGAAAREAGVQFVHVARYKEQDPNAALVVKDVHELSLSSDSLAKIISSSREG